MGPQSKLEPWRRASGSWAGMTVMMMTTMKMMTMRKMTMVKLLQVSEARNASFEKHKLLVARRFPTSGQSLAGKLGEHVAGFGSCCTGGAAGFVVAAAGIEGGEQISVVAAASGAPTVFAAGVEGQPELGVSVSCFPSCIIERHFKDYKLVDEKRLSESPLLSTLYRDGTKIFCSYSIV